MLQSAYQDFYRMFEREMGDRSKTVGASEIGLCGRQTFWKKNQGTAKGVKIDDDYKDDWGARIRGIIMEFAFWVPALRKQHGANLLFAGTEQENIVKGHLSATPDGLLINQRHDALRDLGVKNIRSDCISVECKTIDPRTNLVEAKEVNIYQVNTQLGLFRETTKYKPEYGLLTYTDASFWSEVDEFPVQFDPAMYEVAHSRATEIITDRKSTRLNSSHQIISYAVFCLKKKNTLTSSGAWPPTRTAKPSPRPALCGGSDRVPSPTPTHHLPAPTP